MGRKINKKDVLEKIRENKGRNENRWTSDQMLNGKLIGGGERIDDVLNKALKYAGKDGKILTLPELMQARISVEYNHKYWDSTILPYSEQNIGVDYDGKYYQKGEEVLFIIHGDGLIGHEELSKVYDDMRDPVSVVHSEEEFRMMLNGRDRLGNTFPVYTYEEVKENEEMNSFYDRYGIVVPYELIKDADEQVYTSKEEYLEDPLLISLMGSKRIAGLYYDKCKKKHDIEIGKESVFPFGYSYDKLIKEYFTNIQRKPQGSMLLIISDNYLTSGPLGSLLYKECSKCIAVKKGL